MAHLIRSGTIYPDMVFTRRRWPIVSVSSSKVATFSIVFVSCSKVCGYGSSSCKQEAYPERLKISFRIGTISYLSFSYRLRVNGASVFKEHQEEEFSSRQRSRLGTVRWEHLGNGNRKPDEPSL